MTDSDSFIIYCLSFIGGVFISSILEVWNFFIPQNILFSAIILAIVCAILWRQEKVYLIIGATIFLAAGCWTFNRQLENIKNSPIALLAQKNAFVIARGFIAEEPSIKQLGYQAKVELQEIIDSKGQKKNASKAIIVYTTEQIKYGDLVEVRGALEVPPIFETFDYKRYLEKDGVLAQMRKGSLRIIARARGNPIYGAVVAYRQRMREFAQKVYPANISGTMRAYVLGDKDSIDDKFKTNLAAAGLSHIIAVSGTHIVMFESMIFALMLSLGLWRRQALFSTLFFVLFYCALCGFQVSALRAAVMASFYIVAKIAGRLSQALRILIISAAVMISFNPLLLFYDVSFQLSFFSVLGLCLLQPYFSRKLAWLPEWGIIQLRTNLATTFSALIFTAPLVSMSFGNISLIAPVANLFALPIAGALLMFGAASLFLGGSIPILGKIFALPALPLATYFKFCGDFFGSLPFASLPFKLSIPFLFIYAVFLAFLVAHVRKSMEFAP